MSKNPNTVFQKVRNTVTFIIEAGIEGFKHIASLLSNASFENPFRQVYESIKKKFHTEKKRNDLFDKFLSEALLSNQFRQQGKEEINSVDKEGGLKGMNGETLDKARENPQSDAQTPTHS